MERSYVLSVKVLSENKPRNYRISVDPNNFDDFMTEIENTVSLLKIENFRIDYTGTCVHLEIHVININYK